MSDPQSHSAADLLVQDEAFLDVRADFSAALKEARPHLELDLVEDLEAAHEACVQAAFEAGQRLATPYPGLIEAVRELLRHPAIQAMRQEEQSGE